MPNKNNPPAMKRFQYIFADSEIDMRRLMEMVRKGEIFLAERIRREGQRHGRYMQAVLEGYADETGYRLGLIQIDYHPKMPKREIERILKVIDSQIFGRSPDSGRDYADRPIRKK